jgi:hypothetical protein
MKALTSLAFLSFITLANTGALGSSDQSYVPNYKALASEFARRDVSGALVPSNDTRDNLLFLAADRRKQQLTTIPVTDVTDAAYVAYGEGSICVSDAAGRTGFNTAVAVDSAVPENEKKLLQEARLAIACGNSDGNGTPVTAPVVVQSARGQEFAKYLAAITVFYKDTHYDMAAFQSLSAAEQPWVREASVYMVARVTLLAAQAVVFDEWGTLDRTKADTGVVTAARDALNAYLKAYPQGAYAASATGLLRRAVWLSGDPAEQAAAYSKTLLATDVGPLTPSLIHEVDHKMAEEAYLAPTADPMLVAVQLFRLMRPQEDDKGQPVPGMKVEVLEAYRTRFAGQEVLFDYLLAARAWFVDRDAAAVLKLLPEKTPATDLSYLDFSRQILRVMASDDTSARQTLVGLFPYAKQNYQRVTLELELAKHDERHKNISAVFEKETLIQDPDVRMRVLNYVAGPILLKQQALSTEVLPLERQTALYRLLVRDLTHGRFKGFVEDIKLLPAPEASTDADGNDAFAIFRPQESNTGYTCADVASTAATLAKNPNDVRGHLCLGDFFRGKNYDLELEAASKDDLGGTGTLFAGTVLTRQNFYTDIMKNPKASRDDRAYAIYRAIHCYAPVGQNDCGGTDVDRNVRKKWFLELKAKYGDTTWAKQQDVYW